MLDDARKRVQNSHSVEMQILEKELGISVDKATEAEEMAGDINVAGDTHNTYHVVSEPTSKPSALGTLAKYAAVAALGSALPIAGFALNWWLNQPKTDPVQPTYNEQDWRIGVEVE